MVIEVRLITATLKGCLARIEMTMTKSELINLLIGRIDTLSEKDISDAVNETLELVCNALEEGRRVEVRGFGSYSLHHWGERYARNPTSGETWRTDPVYAVHFKPGKDLRERVNERFLKDKPEDLAIAPKKKRSRVVESEAEAAEG